MPRGSEMRIETNNRHPYCNLEAWRARAILMYPGIHSFEQYDALRYAMRDPWCCPGLRPEIHVPVPFDGVTEGWMPWPDTPVWRNQ